MQQALVLRKVQHHMNANASTHIFTEAGKEEPVVQYWLLLRRQMQLHAEKSGESTEAEAENIVLSLRAGMDQCALSHDLDVDYDRDGAGENALLSLVNCCCWQSCARDSCAASWLCDCSTKFAMHTIAVLSGGYQQKQLAAQAQDFVCWGMLPLGVTAAEHAALGGTAERMTWRWLVIKGVHSLL